jgi:hypothetical protein
MTGAGLAGLAERARDWIDRPGNSLAPRHGPGQGPKTGAYADLFFAFGLARLGERDGRDRLRQRARTDLAGAGQVHEFLLEAFDYRIRQALEGKPHAGPLPHELLTRLADIYQGDTNPALMTGRPGAGYIIDRMRQFSRILEPDQEVSPYRHVGRPPSELERSLRELPDMLDPGQVADRVRGLLGQLAPAGRALVLCAGLDQAPRIGQDLARELLDQAAPTFDALPPPREPSDWVERAQLLRKGLFVAGFLQRADHVRQLVDRFGRLLLSQRGASSAQALDPLAAQAFRTLWMLGMRQDMVSLLDLMVEPLLGDRALRAIDEPEWRARHPGALRTLLHMAAAWYLLGKDVEAGAVLRVARATLLVPLKAPAQGRDLVGRTELACAYATALGHAPSEQARQALEELFEKLEGIGDTFTTSEHYGVCQLRVIEAVVLAAAGDGDFTGRPGTNAGGGVSSGTGPA